MLVLSRKEEESIMIGDSIRIMVLDIQGNQVKLGIKAPKNMPIHREEVQYKIQREKEGKEKEEKADL